MAAIRIKTPIRGGPLAIRKENVIHYIGTLDDRDLARMVILLRLGDADNLKKTVQECENMENREPHVWMGLFNI